MPSDTLCARCGGVGDDGGACPTCGATIARRRLFEDRGDVAAFALGALAGYALILFVAFASSDGPPSVYQLPGLLVVGSGLGVPCGVAFVHLKREPWDDEEE